jgi:uncharacterized protein (TIGR02391 family)
MANPPSFDEASIESIGAVLGETTTGLTGSQIYSLLQACHIPDPGAITKRDRIARALLDEQKRTGSGSCVVAFVQEAMKPVRWGQRPEAFEAMRNDLNAVLGFAGISVGKDGLTYRGNVARTHSEVAQRTRRLRDETVRRGGHADVFKYCTQALVADDCFGAVFEATKGLAERIRQMAGLDLDGFRLVEAAFAIGTSGPMVAINSLRSDTDRNEQSGFMNIMKGIFSAFRNPAAHEPKILWHVSEPDALDLLSMLSLVHRRLDAAVVLRR